MADEQTNPDIAGSIGTGTKAVFREDITSVRLLLAYLELSYEAGVKYKDGRDSSGEPILIEHQNESPDPTAKNIRLVAGKAAPLSRFERRKRLAVCEPHVRTIVDAYAAYAVCNPPSREATKDEEFKRIEIDRWMTWLRVTALKLGEAWIGYDAEAIEAELGTTDITVAQAEQADPKNKGKRYIVVAHPGRIVDFDEVDGEITRVVIEEISRTKASFTAKPKTKYNYREWTATNWTLYTTVKEYDGAAPTFDGLEVRVEKTGNHQLGRCPWFRYRPKFPIEDLCEYTRLLFNLCSVHDEELYKNTFTQVVFTGTTVAQVKSFVRDSGAALVLEGANARAGTIGSDTSQAESIRSRMVDVREQLYRTAAMEGTGQKNVAEAADKKKRDLESLYTALKGIVEELERIENKLLLAMGIIKPEEQQTAYSREFDVLGLQELLDRAKLLFAMPFMPPSFRRQIASKVRQKVDPFADHKKIDAEAEGLFDISEEVITGLTSLNRDVGLPPELIAQVLGIPRGYLAKFIAAASTHRDPMTPSPGQGGLDVESSDQPSSVETSGGGSGSGDSSQGAEEAGDGPGGA